MENILPVLKDKVAIVTGASRGIGRSIALAYAAEGASVVATARSASELEKLVGEIERKGGSALQLPGDIRLQKDVKNLVQKTIERFSRIDILVNNAGRPGSKKQLEEITEEEWDDVMAVNVKGAFLATKEVLPYLLKQKSGNIINISSGAGERQPTGLGNIRSISYSLSKFTLEAFNYIMASRLEGSGINVNAIKPGVINTAFHSTTSPEEMRQLSQRTGGVHEPEFVNQLSIYLAALKPGELNGASIRASDWNKAHLEQIA